MERVGILINKLQEQLLQQADIHNMLVTAQLLQSELLLQCKKPTDAGSKKVAVIVPHSITLNTPGAIESATKEEFYNPFAKPVSSPEPLARPTPEPAAENVTEASMPPETNNLPETEKISMPEAQPEPEPIPHFAEEKPWQRLFVDKDDKTNHWNLDPVMDIPTLAHQEKVVFELNDVMIADNTASLNDTLKQESEEVATKLVDTPVKDLKKAISINDRHRFIHELFRGDETMYERSIKTINGFHIFAEAEYWIQRELKVKLGWDTTLELVKVFDQVVKRRFA